MEGAFALGLVFPVGPGGEVGGLVAGHQGAPQGVGRGVVGLQLDLDGAFHVSTPTGSITRMSAVDDPPLGTSMFMWPWWPRIVVERRTGRPPAGAGGSRSGCGGFGAGPTASTGGKNPVHPLAHGPPTVWLSGLVRSPKGESSRSRRRSPAGRPSAVHPGPKVTGMSHTATHGSRP